MVVVLWEGAVRLLHIPSFLLPPPSSLAGYLVDWSGSAASPIWFDSLVFGSIVPLVLLFRLLQRRQRTSSP